jgi:F0F1-type ATP synthase membrane subunit b/b'
MSELMLWLSGVDRNVLNHCERERNKFIAMGGTVLTTATLACVSATFTTAHFLHVPIVFAVILGIAWGFAIMNLDRWLLISIRRQSTAKRTLLMGVPRIILAFLIGAVIAHPLLLQIFSKEINAQAAKEKSQALEDSERETRQRFAALPVLETKIQTIHAEQGNLANGSVVAESPAYREAVKELHNLERREAKAQDLALCEAEGSQGCGTGKIGEGPAFEAKKEVAESLRSEVESQRAKVNTIAGTITKREANQAGKTRRVGNRQLDRLETQRRRLVKKRDKQRAELEREYKKKIGILDRVAALDTLTIERPELLTMELLIFLFILAIDTLPAVMKMLMALGEPSLYEEVQNDLEEADAIALREQTKAHAKASRIEAGLLVDDATARRASMKEAQDDLVNQSVDAMREAGEKFIALWRQEILERVPRQVREELRRTGMSEAEGEPGRHEPGPGEPGPDSNGSGGGNGHEPGRRPDPGAAHGG